MKRREDLTTPRTAGRVGVSYDSDTFGRFSESIANFLGTARFLVWQTVVWLRIWPPLLLPSPAEDWRAVPVSSRVNHVANDDASLIVPA